MDKAKAIGMEAYEAELSHKVQILEELLGSYDDGRRKGLFCLAVNLLDRSDVDSAMEQIRSEASPDASIKEKAATAVSLLQAIAEERGVVLQLRKK